MIRSPKIKPVLLASFLLFGLLPGQSAGAADLVPQLELRKASSKVTLDRYPGQPVFMDLGTYVASLGGPFEIRVARPDYAQPMVVEQVIHADDATTTSVPIPADTPLSWSGFKNFLRVDIRQAGDLIKTKWLPFCPNGDRQRINDDGPDEPAYPAACFSNPFTRGMLWGIDSGWAVATTPFYSQGTMVWLPEGRYSFTVQIAPRYVSLFNVDPIKASVQLNVTVRSAADCSPCPIPMTTPTSSDAAPEQHVAGVPTNLSPDPATLPDLIALPAWNVTTYRDFRSKRDLMSFAANIWTAGAQDLVVEGFRADGEDTMDAYQYFYENGEPVGRAPVGTMAYDVRRMHQHWHFKQFAGYTLLDSTQTEVVRSRKEAFCLAPTDAIDVLIPNVDLTPFLGLSTACGGANALWVREVLPLGWGDTYYQTIPGQSFNITNVPNGTYYIKVTANPTGLLYEQSTANNSELREVRLRGRPGHRRVIVPPWNGIDTETGITFGHR